MKINEKREKEIKKIAKKIDEFASSLLEEGKNTDYSIDYLVASSLVMNVAIQLQNKIH